MQILPPSSQIAMPLREEVRNGAYTVGERLPTERELQQQFNASRGTILRALATLGDDFQTEDIDIGTTEAITEAFRLFAQRIETGSTIPFDAAGLHTQKVIDGL